MSGELEPCPFCGSLNIGITHEGSVRTADCKDCGTMGPYAYGYPTTAQVIVAWNRRSPAPQMKRFSRAELILLSRAITARIAELEKEGK